jgi:hypothetical protein
LAQMAGWREETTTMRGNAGPMGSGKCLDQMSDCQLRSIRLPPSHEHFRSKAPWAIHDVALRHAARVHTACCVLVYLPLALRNVPSNRQTGLYTKPITARQWQRIKGSIALEPQTGSISVRSICHDSTTQARNYYKVKVKLSP